METRKVSKKELALMMLEQECTFIGFKSVTEPTMKKTNNPFYGAVLKVSFVSSVIGYNYERVINNRRIKEAQALKTACEKFKSAGLKWGEFVGNSRVVIRHKGKIYIQNIVLKTRKPIYLWANNGKELSDTEVAELRTFFPKKKEGERQGLSSEKTAVIRTYCLDNLTRVNMNGMKLVVN